jgi:uncharacterized protein YbaR (Trm112 family)
MSESISCSCGYSGPGRAEGPVVVCPLCGEPAGQVVTEQKKWRIPCPNGHVSKVPEALIGKRLVCPKCNEAFVPTISDSLEKREEARRRQEREEAKFAKKWLTIAIWAAALFGLLLVSLIVMSVLRT